MKTFINLSTKSRTKCQVFIEKEIHKIMYQLLPKGSINTKNLFSLTIFNEYLRLIFEETIIQMLK